MSGDHQNLKLFDVLESSQGQKDNKPYKIFVIVNGQKLHSNLNPNALEFVPSYLQRTSQLNLNDELKKSILKNKPNEKEDENKNRIENENQIVSKAVIEKEYYLENHVETSGLKNNDKNFEKQTKDINIVEEVVDIKKSIEDIKNTFSKENVNFGNEEPTKVKENENRKGDISLDNEEVFTLFNGPTNVIFTSSETLVSSTESIEIKNSLHKNEELEVEIPDVCNITKDIKQIRDSSDDLKEIASNNVLGVLDNKTIAIEMPAEPSTIFENKNNFNNQVIKAPVFHKYQQRNLNLKTNFSSNAPIIGAIRKTNFSLKYQQEIKDSKNVNTRIDPNPIKLKSNTSTSENQKSKQSSFSNHQHTNNATKTLNNKTECKCVELNSKTTIVSNTKCDKRSINYLKTSLGKGSSCKSSISTICKVPVQPINKAIVSKKVIRSNSTTTTSSTDKSITSNRSSTQSNKFKPLEKPLSLCKTVVVTSPRPTVSSKLRKTETQKRRNLFHDIDTIKMSDSLFK